jgi:3-oxoacyl-[acyl-carrier protein] reductase
MPDWDVKPGFDLAGRRALIVGTGNAVAREVALAYAEAGADVAVASATLDGDEIMEAKRISKEVAKLGRKTFAQGWDVTLPTNVQVGLKQLIKEFGHPNVLVYNADAALSKPIEKTTDADFAHIQQVNQNGAFYAARSFLRELPDGTRGRLIFLNTIFAERGVDNFSAYTMAKAGVNGLVTALSQELGGRDITVNSISTGWMDFTPGRGPDDIGQNRLLRFIPLRRFGKGGEVAALAVLLASDAAGYINGQILHVDGGVMIHL